MGEDKKPFKKINASKINDLVKTGNKILKILYILFISLNSQSFWHILLL